MDDVCAMDGQQTSDEFPASLTAPGKESCCLNLAGIKHEVEEAKFPPILTRFERKPCKIAGVRQIRN